MRNWAYHESRSAIILSSYCVLALAVAVPVTSAAQTPNQTAPRAVAPPAAGQVQTVAPETLIILIRSSLDALSQANITNNYTVLNALGSQSFRKNNTPQRLATVFKSFRDNRVDLSPVVYLNPQLTSEPMFVGGKMRLVGIFASKPMQVNFDLTFEPEDGVWKLSDIGANLSNPL